MSTEIQGVKVTYSGIDIIPSPFISISYAPMYSDSGEVIGITNNIKLNGTISSYIEKESYEYQGSIEDFTTQNIPLNILQTESGVGDKIVNENDTFFIITGDPDPSAFSWTITGNTSGKAANILPLISGIKSLNNILNKNGCTLQIKDTNENVIIEAVGGKLISLVFENGTTSWSKILPYTAEMEFSSINFFGENLACNEKFDGGYLIDIDKYPIKTFNDSWSINVVPESLNYAKAVSGINNSIINITYDISAVGKNYYSDPLKMELKPAWEIAKNFVQQRLHQQVTNLIMNVLVPSGSGKCLGDSMSGIMNLEQRYGVCNEIVNCSFSELAGSFSATYTSILKAKSTGSYDSDYARHNINMNVNTNSEDKNKTKKTTVLNGTIEGLIPGGLIKITPATFQLPNQGSFLIGQNIGISKFAKAKELANKIIVNNTDLTESFKIGLGIIATSGGLPSGCIPSGSPMPVSFSVVENRIEGTIQYSAEYTNELIIPENTGASINVTNITVDYTDSTPILAEFILPDSGVVLQDIRTVTGKEISYTITGKNKDYIKLQNISSSFPIENITDLVALPFTIPSIEQYSIYNYDGLIEKNKTRDIDLTTGEFTIRIVYACTSGCMVSMTTE